VQKERNTEEVFASLEFDFFRVQLKFALRMRLWAFNGCSFL